MSYFVYILKCSDGTYYTGITNNLSRRLNEHDSGKNIDSYTYSRRPIELVFRAEYTNVNTAILFEKRIKKWSRAKKEALIAEQYQKLPELSKKKFKK